MNLNQFLQILFARKWVVLIVIALTVGGTAVVNLLLPKEYTATAALIVDSKSKDPFTGQLLPSGIFPGYLATQVEIIKSMSVAGRVVRELKLDQNPQVRQSFNDDTGGRGDIVTWMAGRLLPKLDVETSHDSNLIVIAYSGADPQFSAVIANAFAKAYLDTSMDLKLAPAKQAVGWFDQQIAQMRANLDDAQRKLTAYQKEHNLVESEERLDVETRRLAEVSSQIVAAQSLAFDAASRARGGNTMPEINNSFVVQNLKVQVAQSEGKVAELGKRLGTNHPDYQRAQVELETLRAKLGAEVNTASRGVGASATAARQRYSELESAYAQQKAKVLALKDQREQAALLAREVQNAQQIYDAASQRYGQSRMEAQSTQTDIAVLNPATPPTEATKPRVVLNVLISLFLGCLLGLGAGLTVELFDRRVRSAYDLTQALDIAVLGAVAAPRGRLRRLLSPKRALLTKA